MSLKTTSGFTLGSAMPRWWRRRRWSGPKGSRKCSGISQPGASALFLKARGKGNQRIRVLTSSTRHGPRRGAFPFAPEALFLRAFLFAALLKASAAALLFCLGCTREPPLEPLDAPFSGPAPLEQIAWPEAPASAALDDRKRGLAQALELYGEGEREKGDALVASSLYSLDRCGALR